MLDAAYALARFNLSYLLLRQGRFEEGWCCLEARDWYGRLESYLQLPRWVNHAGYCCRTTKQTGAG